MPEIKPCTKSNKGNLLRNEHIVTLPAVVGSPAMPELAQTSLSNGVPAEFWVCSNCRALELYYHPL